MWSRVAVVAAALVLAPLGAKAADLVVWWNEGYYAEEDAAVREIVAAFEQRTGKRVELAFHPEQELPDTVVAAVEAGEPPDFVFSVVIIQDDAQWAYEGRLVDLTGAVQLLSRPRSFPLDLRHRKMAAQEVDVWPKAVHRVVTEGISPEQAVDEAIAQIKQILSE